MKQLVIPGGQLDCLTREEAAELLAGLFEKATEERVRSSATIQLDANGNGQEEVYLCPMGFEFEARRVSFDLSTATDPNTGQVNVGAAGVQTPATNSATGANAALAPALPGVGQGLTNYVTGFEITGSGATAGSVITVTLAGVQGGTMTFDLVVPTGVTTSIVPLQVEFPQPIPATGPNVAIVLNVPAFGAGNTNAAAVLHGFTQANALPNAGSKPAVRYLRSGTAIAWAQPEYGPTLQVPGVETWGDEQGPYVRNGEVFEVLARGLTPNAILDVTVEGIQRRLPGPQGTAS